VLRAETIGPLGLALLFATIFVFGDWLRLLAPFSRHQRALVSFSAGIAVAYVFVHLAPELDSASIALVRIATESGVAFLASYDSVAVMVGFMLSYGISHMVRWARSDEDEDRVTEEVGEVDLGFRIHIGAFALYVSLVSCLRINAIEGGGTPIVLFAVAMGTHFLTADHAFRRDYGAAYVRVGRFALAGAALAGWALGAVAELPQAGVILLFGYVSGAIITGERGQVLAVLDGRPSLFRGSGAAYLSQLSLQEGGTRKCSSLWIGWS
jgi:hypothetical protein